MCRTPQKVVPPYSLGICPSKTPRHFEALSLLHREKIDFLKASFFWQITQMALESPKIDICQNWPRRVLGDVIRCLESKFDKKIPMGSVPNCQKENSMRHAIRWFKSKLEHLKTNKRTKELRNKVTQWVNPIHTTQHRRKKTAWKPHYSQMKSSICNLHLAFCWDQMRMSLITCKCRFWARRTKKRDSGFPGP